MVASCVFLFIYFYLKNNLKPHVRIIKKIHFNSYSVFYASMQMQRKATQNHIARGM